MRANAFTLSLAAFVAGIFGFFLRWLQNLNGFNDKGLPVADAKITGVFLVYSLIVVVFFFLEEKLFFKKLSRSPLAAEAFYKPNIIVRALAILVAAIMIIGSLIFMFSSDFARYPGMQRITGALGIFAGICIPLMLSGKDEKDGGYGSVASLIPVLFCCLWLVTAYRVQSENPIRWSYAPAILAIIALLVAFYYVSAYFYGRAKPARCFFALQLAVYLCMVTLIDGHSLGEILFFGSGAAAGLIVLYVLLGSAMKDIPKIEVE